MHCFLAIPRIMRDSFEVLSPFASRCREPKPRASRIRKKSDKAAMRWCVERMNEELRNPQPGGFLVAQQLACMMLVRARRLHLAEGLKGKVGWLFALSDKQMSTAITSMHNEP